MADQLNILEDHMQPEDVLKCLMYWMFENGQAPEAVEAYSWRWRHLKVNDYPPCPRCFGEELEHPLIGRISRNNYEPLYCEQCKQQFEIKPGNILRKSLAR